MNTNKTITFIAVLCLGTAATALAQQNHEELKQRVLAQAQSFGPDDYAFTRTVRTEETSKGKTEKKVIVEKFDPAKPADARWTLVSVDGAPPSADALKRHQKEAAKRRIVPGYHRLATYFGSAATSSEVGGKTVFRFATLPKGSVSVLDTDVSQNASAEVSVTGTNAGPYAEQVRITIRPMRLKLVMKLDQFESIARYRIGPNGKPLLMEQVQDMVGSGMGQEGKIHTEITYSDYRTVRGER